MNKKQWKFDIETGTIALVAILMLLILPLILLWLRAEPKEMFPTFTPTTAIVVIATPTSTAPATSIPPTFTPTPNPTATHTPEPTITPSPTPDERGGFEKRLGGVLYVIQPGDSLWRLACIYYDDCLLWPLIYQWPDNFEAGADPNLIHAGNLLWIPELFAAGEAVIAPVGNYARCMVFFEPRYWFEIDNREKEQWIKQS